MQSSLADEHKKFTLLVNKNAVIACFINKMIRHKKNEVP